jgi:hypothetical protein
MIIGQEMDNIIPMINSTALIEFIIRNVLVFIKNEIINVRDAK